jgi:colanic acid biosynthesis glycosyl transferase WcaI
MRVLILVNQYPPDVNSTGVLMRDLAIGLTKRGHQVHVVTSFPHYADFRITKEHRGRLIETTIEDGIEVTRVWVFASGHKQRMWHRLLSYSSYNLGAFLAAQGSAADYDVALAPSGSFFTGVTAALLGALRGFRFVYNVQDVYPEVPARAGQLRVDWQVRALELVARWMWRKAARVTVISEAQRTLLEQKGVPSSKLRVIPNFVDVDRIRPLPRDADLAQRFGWDGQFLVMHSGNLGFAYDFDALLAAARRLVSDRSIRFVVIGDGVRKPELQARAAEWKLENVQFLPFQPAADLPRLRSCADLQLSLYRRGSSAYSLPSKLYEIMASGRPVIASAEGGSDVAQLVQRGGAGVCIAPEDAGQLADAITALRRQPAERTRMSERGRAYVVAHHSIDVAVDAYEKLLLDVVDQH